MKPKVALRSKIFIVVWAIVAATVFVWIIVGKPPEQLLGFLLGCMFASSTLKPHRVGFDSESIDEIPAVAKITFYPSGNVGAFDSQGHQISEIQGSWIDSDYLRKLAQVAARDGAMTVGLTGITEVVGRSFVGLREFYEAVNGEELEDAE